MKHNSKKDFFRRPTAAHILKNTNNREVKEDFWENIISLKDDESVTLVGRLFAETPNEFLKRGPVLEVPVFLPENPDAQPWQIRQKIFDDVKNQDVMYFRGFTYTPMAGVDFTPRIIRLNELLEGARLYAYAPIKPANFRPSTQIKNVHDKKPDGKGAGLTVVLPSETKGARKYEIEVAHIPLINDGTKYDIAQMTKTEHKCSKKKRDEKYRTRKEPELIAEYVPCMHEFAALYAMMDFYKNRQFYEQNGKRNIIPITMNMTGIPSKLMLKAYDNMLHRVLIKERPDIRPHILHGAELAALPWEGIRKEGYEKTLYLHGLETKLGNFEWTTYKK